MLKISLWLLIGFKVSVVSGWDMNIGDTRARGSGRPLVEITCKGWREFLATFIFSSTSGWTEFLFILLSGSVTSCLRALAFLSRSGESVDLAFLFLMVTPPARCQKERQKQETRHHRYHYRPRLGRTDVDSDILQICS